MLALPITNSWGFVYTNQANGSSVNAIGVQVVPGYSNVEGNWVEIAGDASITSDIHYVSLLTGGLANSGVAANALMDFGWDPAGGTSYVSFFDNFVMGANQALNAGHGKSIHFPCKIPAGSAIAVRSQTDAASGNFYCWGHFFGKPSRPELWRNAAYAETLGTISNSSGTSFTPGNAAFGTWASLGTTTKKHHWAQLGVQINNATKSGHGTRVQLGIGAGGASDTHVICDGHFQSNTLEQEQMPRLAGGAWEIPAGAELWVRGNNSAAPVTGYNATAVLFGG